MAGKVFAFSCNVDGGSSIGAGTTSVYVNLDPVIQPGQNLVVDLSQHISCWNDYGGWYDTDHINLVQGSAFAGSLQSYKGSLYWNNVTYPFPLTTNTNVLDIGDKTPMPLPLKLYITPVGAAGGRVNLIALTPDGKRSSRRMDRLKVVIYPMADRSLVTYFPESNHMLTLDNHDPLSGIPGYKSIPVELEPSN
ncbi:fimbrial protein [Escherichia coli]|nr:fimbrial protein [Escherichia coli]